MRAAVGPERRPRPGVADQLQDRPGEGVGIVLVDEKSAPAVVDDFRDAGVAGADDGEPAGLRLHERDRSPFPVSVGCLQAGEHEEMGAIEQAADVGPVAGAVEVHDALETQFADCRLQVLGERPVADDVVPERRRARDLGDRAERDQVSLLLDESPDR